jgi:HEAT repeat protein
MMPSVSDRQKILDIFHKSLSTDTNPVVRAKAAEVMGKLGDPAAAPVLLTALLDRDQSVRRSAIQSLGQLRTTIAIPASIQALADQALSIRIAAIDSFQTKKKSDCRWHNMRFSYREAPPMKG